MNKNIDDVTNDHVLEVWRDRLAAFRVDLNNLIYFERGPIIHSGGFGDVRKAILVFPAQTPSKDNRSLNGMGQRPVAVKTLRLDTTTEMDRFEKRIIRETYIWSQLNNEHVLEFLGYHFATRDSSTEAFLVCPWLENGQSVEYVKQRDLGIMDRLRLLLESAEGLLYLHSHVPPICHGDVKGANVLIKDDGHAALSDFGLAQISEKDFGGIASKTVQRGTIRWSSPERVSEDDPPAPPSDVWSWSWLIWEIITGTIPFPSVNNAGCVVYHIISARLPRCEEDAAIARVPSLAQLMHRCWQQDPQSRPSMASCIRFLKRIMEELDPHDTNLPQMRGGIGTLQTSDSSFTLPPPHELGITLPPTIAPIRTARLLLGSKLEPLFDIPAFPGSVTSTSLSGTSSVSSSDLPTPLPPLSGEPTPVASVMDKTPKPNSIPHPSHSQQEGLDGMIDKSPKDQKSGFPRTPHRPPIFNWAKDFLHLSKHENEPPTLASSSKPLPSIPSSSSLNADQRVLSATPQISPTGASTLSLREPSLEEPPWKVQLEFELEQINAAQMQLWRAQENMHDYLARLSRWLSQAPALEKPLSDTDNRLRQSLTWSQLDFSPLPSPPQDGPRSGLRGDQSPPRPPPLPSLAASTTSDFLGLHLRPRNAVRQPSIDSSTGYGPVRRSSNDRIMPPPPIPRAPSPVHEPSLGPYPILREPPPPPPLILEPIPRVITPIPVVIPAAVPQIQAPVPRILEPIPPPAWFHWREVVEYSRVIDPREPDAHRGILVNTNREVAIKPLDTPGQDSRPDISKRDVLYKPLGRWMQLSHQNIADVLGGFVRADGTPSVITAWYSSGNISDFVKKNDNVDRKLLLYQVAQGLAYLHDQEPAVVHCNLKPNNVLIDESSNSRLGDVGILGFLESSTSGKKLFGRLGDVRWTSPEVLEGGSRTTGSDVYAFGCLALAILKDRPPFSHLDSDASLAKAIYEGELPLSDAEARELHSTWRLCFSRNAARRPTMEAVLESLPLW